MHGTLQLVTGFMEKGCWTIQEVTLVLIMVLSLMSRDLESILDLICLPYKNKGFGQDVPEFHIIFQILCLREGHILKYWSLLRNVLGIIDFVESPSYQDKTHQIKTFREALIVKQLGLLICNFSQTVHQKDCETAQQESIVMDYLQLYDCDGPFIASHRFF